MSTYSCIRYHFEKIAALRGYRCDVHREHLSYLNGNTYAVAIADPLTRRYARYRFSDEDLQASGWRISDFAGMVFGHLIDEIRKENEKMEIGYLPINVHCDHIVKFDDTVKIKNVIFNPPATIVFWTDGTKTVVKTQNDEEFDPEKGLTMAYFKKMHGNKGHYFEEIKKWTEKYEDQNTVKYTDEELEVAYSEFEKNLMKLNDTVLNYLAAKNDSTPGDNQCQST